MSVKIRLLLLLAVSGILLPAFDPSPTYHYPLDGYHLLAGTFGELRSNHFHSGIDIKTGGQEGASVFAIESGYVYRVRVSPYGFGKALYLRHPDGNYSVYAHLSKFTPEVEAYLTARQQETQQYEQDLYPAYQELKFDAGALIGYSGNSGSSTAPHLHFEIRDPDEHITNALAYYRHLVKDQVPPLVRMIGMEPLSAESRVNGQFKKLTLAPSGGSGRYTLPNPIRIRGPVGLEYQAIDRLTGVPNPCGINHARLYLDDELIYELDLGKFSFEETRYINMHIDYAYYKKTGRRLERAYIEEGNRFHAYKKHKNSGVITLKDHDVHQLRLELQDLHGNQSTVEAKLQLDDGTDGFQPSALANSGSRFSLEQRRNVLVLTAEQASKDLLKGIKLRSQAGTLFTQKPSYQHGQTLVFLMPMDRFNYPKEILSPDGRFSIAPDLIGEIRPEKSRQIDQGQVRLFFPYNAVFQPTFLRVSERSGSVNSYSLTYEIGSTDIPILKPFMVGFKPDANVPKKYLVVAKRNRRGAWKFAGNTWGAQGEIYASVSEFGEFCLMTDSIPPTVRPFNFRNGGYIGTGQRTISLRAEDSFAGINSKRTYATLDGKWIPFAYNYRRDRLTYTWTERPEKGEHILEISVFDGAGNKQKAQYTLRF